MTKTEADRVALRHMAVARAETPRVLWANIQGALASLASIAWRWITAENGIVGK